MKFSPTLYVAFDLSGTILYFSAAAADGAALVAPDAAGVPPPAPDADGVPPVAAALGAAELAAPTAEPDAARVAPVEAAGATEAAPLAEPLAALLGAGVAVLPPPHAIKNIASAVNTPISALYRF